VSLSSWLATFQDERTIGTAGAAVEPRTTLLTALPEVSGVDVATMLGGRLLLRYFPQQQLGVFKSGTAASVYATPTAMPVADLADCLGLPNPKLKREWAMLLDPAQIPVLKGPHWISLGEGIEFLLHNGFPQNAIVDVGEVRVR
jgi:hypothetical protein